MACEDTAAIESWLLRESHFLPEVSGLTEADRRSLALMLVSFAATSFNERAFQMRAPSAGKKARAKASASATTLRTFALEALAAEEGLELTATIREQIATGWFPEDLTLVAYANELIRRTEYASQGPAVYLLWLELRETTRDQLSVESVQDAERRLIEWVTRPVPTANEDDID